VIHIGSPVVEITQGNPDQEGGGLSGNTEKHGSAGDLELELRQLLKRLEDGPIPDELRVLARKLEEALKQQRS
jgi:hypothetical protein